MKKDTIADKIIKLLLEHKRRSHVVDQQCQGADCLKCQTPHMQQILHTIRMQKPIELILPAFPAKSPNRQKTLSAKPDKGEVVGLTMLNTLCQRIQKEYAPGANMVICSDGRVFNDLLHVSDAEVNAYQQGIIDIIHTYQLQHLSTFSLDEAYPSQNAIEMRTQLMQQFGEPLISFKQRLQQDITLLYQFNGIHRFIVEDQLPLKPLLSKNQLRNAAKVITYDVVRRSNAWSRLLQIQFPNSVRLSIHPQHCGSDKLGIAFIPSANRWATPWHNVLLKRNGCWELIKRSDAERIGASLCHDHYVLEAC